VTILAVSAAAGSVTSSQVMPGVLGFLVVAVLSVALFFLLRSMNKQLRKVQPPASAGAAKAEAAEAEAETAEAGAAEADAVGAGERPGPGQAGGSSVRS